MTFHQIHVKMTTIRYIGSKKALIDWLVENFKLDEVKSFAEPMSGTGTVSSTVSKLKPDCKVFANDICCYASILASSLLKPFNQEHFDKYHSLITQETCLAKGFIFSDYAEEGSERLYFNSFNSQRIDGARKIIEDAEDLDEPTKNALIASVIIGADKTANTTGVYISFLKKLKNNAVTKVVFPRLISTDFKNGVVFNGDAIDFIKEIPRVDLMYIDPPYTNRGYCSYYHVLETIAVYDQPQLRGITGQREDSLKKNGDLYKKTTAFKYFEKLLKLAVEKAKRIVISYSSDSLVPIENLTSLLSQYGKVSIQTKDYKKYVSQVDQEGGDEGVVEYLHHLEVRDKTSPIVKPVTLNAGEIMTSHHKIVVEAEAIEKDE